MPAEADTNIDAILTQFDCTELTLFVNGQRVDVPSVDPRTTLAHFLRENLNLRGTKIGCNEGGCGACTVMVSDIDPLEEKVRHYSVIACLTPLCAVFGKAVTSVEAISAGYKRLHPVQERLSVAHGSQCGYCTPGFVMAMYALLRNNPQPTEAQVDECLQGNLCRCTGYRPILEAFYSFANGTSSKSKAMENGCCGKAENCCMKKSQQQKMENGVEELAERKSLSKLTELVDVQGLDPSQELIFPPELVTGKWHRKSFGMQWGGLLWLQPTSLAHFLALKRQMPNARIMGGNTEIGVELKFRHVHAPVTIAVKQIAELQRHWLDEKGLWVGAGLSLNETKTLLNKFIAELPGEKTAIFMAVNEILHLFAGQHVRNMATIAGNIATASPISDLNPLWMASGARVLLESELRGQRQLPLDQTFFPAYRQTAIAADELLRAIHIPFSGQGQHFRVYKQAQRRDDDIAIVTGAFLAQFETKHQENCSSENGPLSLPMFPRLLELRMAFGGVGPTTRLATKSVQGLAGKEWDQKLFDEVSRRLGQEFCLAEDAPGGMARYRQTLVLSFFLKFFLHVQQEQLVGGADGKEKELTRLSDLNGHHFESTQFYQDVPAGQSSADPVGRPLMHGSGEKHAKGQAVYTTDMQLPSDCLHMAYVQSPIASGTLNSLDFSAALQMPGVVGAIDWRDVPGSGMIGHAKDMPLFVRDKISYHGQPLAAILASDSETARRAAAKVHVQVEKSADKPTVTIEEAIERKSFLLPKPLRIHSSLALPGAQRTHVDWSKFTRIVEGQIRIGGQEHFYLETQNCVAIPGEGDEMNIVASTQCINDVQGDVATALGVQRNVVSVKVRRIGGGFGGKESCCGLFAAAAAIGAKKFRRPVRFWLERFDDMAITGNRHPFRFDYRLALDNEDKFAALEVQAYNNCGFSMDLSVAVMERALAHLDNVYRFGNADLYGHLCRTHLASNTAFRGFGGPQGMFATETIVKHTAEHFGLDPDKLRETNMYVAEGDCTHFGMHLRQCNIRRCWAECRQWSELEVRKAAVAQWNSQHRYVKRGIYAVPTKFGIAFSFKRLNQAGALLNVYTDGSVLISHGGMEMGQGLHTKISQIAARCLGIDLALIQIVETATDKVPNASPTAASVGSDVNGLAVQNACETLLKRLEPLRAELPKEAGWKELVMHAYSNRVQLSATGFATIHSEPVDFAEGRGSEYYSYFVYGVGCAEVELDCLTGDHRLLRVDIVMDVGDSLNPAVDIGQIEGAFVQGYGLFTMEELKVRPDGSRLTRGPGTYKIPSADDAPRQFHVKLLAGSSNKTGIFSSKAVGEPPLFLGSAAFFAIREAIRAYRLQNGCAGYFRLDSPATPERIRTACEDSLTRQAVSKPASEPWTVEL